MSVERMKALVIGAGEVGTNVARTLSADGHEVIVIESDPERCEQARDELDALVIEGNGASPRILREQNVKSIDLLAAVTAIDEVNIAAAAAAHQLGSRRPWPGCATRTSSARTAPSPSSCSASTS